MTSPHPRIVAIASGKGGVGKTWLSTTLAQAYARSGRKVLLFDGDIGLANVDVQLGLAPVRDVGDVFAGKVRLRDAVTSYQGAALTFDIIAGKSGTGSLAYLPSEPVEALTRDLAGLAGDYDVVLLDLGAGIEQNVRLLAQTAGICVVVLTDDPTSLTDAYAFIKLMRRDAPETGIGVAVNQAESRKQGEKTFEAIHRACRQFLRFSPALAGVIRRDAQVREAIRRQEPLFARAPKCTAATDVAALAVTLQAGSLREPLSVVT